MVDENPSPGGDMVRVVAVILAVGLAVALNMIVAAVLYDAIHNPAQAGISENATQILTGWGGGIIGILGAVFGYRAGSSSTPTTNTDAQLYEEEEE